MDYRRKRNENSKEDKPTHSRLFIVCDKSMTENQIEEEFRKFGTIEDVWIPRDRNSGEPKGVAYVKFSKTSEAAYALEEMDCKIIANCKYPLKVMVASNRSDIQPDDQDEKPKRLFISVPGKVTESQIRDEFAEFGNVESVIIQRDRNSGEPKPFGYVTFRSFKEAAVAFEQCDKKYRAIFAVPRGHNRRNETNYESNISYLAKSTSNIKTSLVSMMNTQAKGYTRVNFMCSPFLTQMQVKRLFDIIPGLENCRFSVDFVGNFGKGTASYSNPVCAAFAVEKLNEFEYPPGVKLFVRPDNSTFPRSGANMNIPNAVNNLKQITSNVANSSSPDLAQLAEAITEASKLIKMATAGVSDNNIPDSNDLNYCSVKLPPPQPLADIDAIVAKRCFLVCKPQPPPLTALRDIFCRFGNLINVYTLPNKTIGYARYANTESADRAIQILHGAEICGIRIKVLEAEDEFPSTKMRYD